MSWPSDLLATVKSESVSAAADASSELKSHLTSLLHILDEPSINLFRVRGHLLAHGLPPMSHCAPSLRALVWKLLLGVLPSTRLSWTSTVEANRALYAEYIEQLVQEPEIVTYLRFGILRKKEERISGDYRGPLVRRPVAESPLDGVSSPSQWSRYWSDSALFDQINKDVFRTRPELSAAFFSLSPSSKTVTARGRCATEGSIEPDSPLLSPKTHAFRVANIVAPVTHHDRLCRILFIYSRLHSGYVQGMNEIVAVLYYTFYTDPIDGHNVEADTFFGFNALMTGEQFGDIFCKTLDESKSGILGRIQIVREILQFHDPELGDHLNAVGLKFDFFALRWIMLLFAHDFELLLVQNLWDAILSDQSPTAPPNGKGALSGHLVHYICLAMIFRMRQILLEADFSECMHLLQSYPPFNPRDVIKYALRIRKGFIAKTGTKSGLSMTSEDGVRYVTPPETSDEPASGEEESPPTVDAKNKSKLKPLAVMVRLVKGKFKKKSEKSLHA